MSDRRLIFLVNAALLTGCGQTGKLYLPEPATEVVTRPTQTPPEDEESRKKDGSQAPSETRPQD